ncbi:MAG: hypothetical protein L7F78_16785, partial [Syntrophales bacterium LBB04]|nr:hypothetical protein [Syntrophales bacterium LBB04]
GNVRYDFMKNELTNKMMARIDIDSWNDRIALMRGHIDYGPNPKDIHDAIINIRKRRHNVIFFLGNYEQMFLDFYFEQKDETNFLYNGGSNILMSYGYPRSGRNRVPVPDNYMKFFTIIQFCCEIDRFILVHARLRLPVTLAEQNLNNLVLIRYKAIGSQYAFWKIVVFAHTLFSFTLSLLEKKQDKH